VIKIYLDMINNHLVGVYYLEDGQLFVDMNGRRKGSEKYKPLIIKIEEEWLWILVRWYLRDNFFNPFTEKWERLEYPDQEWDTLLKYGKKHTL